MKKNKNVKDEELETLKEKIVSILKKHKIKKAGIFGSYARGEQKNNSDIDLLIKVKDNKFSLLDFVGLKLDLENTLGIKVDLVEYETIKPKIREKILNEEIKIL